MKGKINRETLMAKLRRIVRITKTPLTIHSQSGMPGRIYQVQDENGGYRNLSDMLSGKEMESWLDGYETALVQLGNETIVEARSRAVLDPESKCAAAVIGCLFCPCPDCRKTVRERERSRKQTMKGWEEL